MGNKIIIVAGVAGGASAVARLRRLDESSSIILVERGEYISFANCGLPYYIGETIQECSKLLVQTVPGLSSRPVSIGYTEFKRGYVHSAAREAGYH